MDKRKKYTRMFIREALLDLLQTKHLNEITVKELCEKADINRATFYRNYLDIYDLYEKMEQELVDSSFSTGDMKRDRQNMLQLIYDNQNFYREFFYSRLKSPFITNTIEEMETRMKEMLQKQGKYDETVFPILYQYNVSGALGVIEQWLNEGCQMPPEQLEQSIIDFANLDYDVLLATSIIESGIDMPNVNTIIINNAQNFGLSELHQLRGRVGRSNRKAFCYMLVPPNIPLTPVAKRRLQAIESFSELGSGIHIAMQDLDIRGAGNLLGAEQSGFIADLGYETYQKILREAVLELRTEEFADEFAEENKEKDAAYVAECTVETDMEIYFPAMYVPQEGERISLYQELDNMERETDVLAFKKRLEDRFGKIPREGLELIRIVSLRRLGKSLGIEKIVFKEKKMYLYFVGSDTLAYYQSDTFGKILNFATRNIKRCQLREVRERRSILVSEVPSIEEGVAILTEISATPA